MLSSPNRILFPSSSNPHKTQPKSLILKWEANSCQFSKSTLYLQLFFQTEGCRVPWFLRMQFLGSQSCTAFKGKTSFACFKHRIQFATIFLLEKKNSLPNMHKMRRDRSRHILRSLQPGRGQGPMAPTGPTCPTPQTCSSLCFSNNFPKF